MSQVESPNRSKYSQHYQEERYRWVNLLVYLLAALVNNIPSQSFSSINSLVERQFNYSPFVVTLNTLAFPILHPLIAVPTNYILDYFGMRIGCLIGGVLLVGGVWGRVLIQYQNPTMVILGSVLSAIGNIFILNCPSKLAVSWFRQDMIPAVISVCVLASMISVTAGASIPGLILSSEATQQQIQQFFMYEAIAITIPIGLMILLLRQKPQFYPNRACEEQNTGQKQKYSIVLKKLFTNKEYIKIMLAMMFSYGNFSTVMATLDQCLSTLNYNEPGKTTSLIILSAMLIGMVSTFLFSTALRNTLKYKYLCTLGMIDIIVALAGSIMVLACLQLVLCLEVQNLLLLSVLGSCSGFFLIPQISMFLAYGSEAVFPLGQASSSGYQFAISQTFSFIFTIAIVNVIDKNNKYKIYGVFGLEFIFLICSMLLILSTRQHLRRVQFLTNSNKSQYKQIQQK